MRTALRILTVAAGLLILASAAHAQPEPTGSADCVQWFDPAHRQDGKKWIDTAIVWMRAQHVAHPVVGLRGDPWDQVNSKAQIYAYVDQYCRVHPLMLTRDAVAHLYRDLAQEQARDESHAQK